MLTEGVQLAGAPGGALQMLWSCEPLFPPCSRCLLPSGRSRTATDSGDGCHGGEVCSDRTVTPLQLLQHSTCSFTQLSMCHGLTVLRPSRVSFDWAVPGHDWAVTGHDQAVLCCPTLALSAPQAGHRVSWWELPWAGTGPGVRPRQQDGHEAWRNWHICGSCGGSRGQVL